MNIRNYLILIHLILICLLIISSSCNKDELTEPVSLSLEFTMNTEIEQGKFLKFDQGDLVFKALEFDGNRETGQDIFFISTFEKLIVADLDSNYIKQKVSYDIPQGIYKRIKLRISSNDELSAGPELTFTGIYSSIKDGDIPVKIEFSDIDPIEIIATESSAGSEIVINKEIPAKAEIFFDPVFLFQVSNSRQLESATISLVDDKPIIIISKDSNSVIFNIIINRLERSVSANFN